MALSFCIPTYNRLPHIKKLIESIRENIGNYTYEIIVADGGSTDGTIEYLKKQTDVKLIEQGKLTGSIKAFNIAFKKAKYEYIFWPSDDFIVNSKVLIKCCNLMDKHPEIGMVSPKFVESTYSNFPNISRWENKLIISKTHIFRTSVLKELGYFDEKFRTYYVDADSSFDVLYHGYVTLFSREAGAIHLRLHDETRKSNVNAVREKEEYEYYVKKWENLDKSLRPSAFKRFRARAFGFIQSWIQENSIMKRMMKNDNEIAINLFDWLLQRCVVYDAKEYTGLKGFYLAQKLPKEALRREKHNKS